jgi:hypothetical protein
VVRERSGDAGTQTHEHVICSRKKNTFPLRKKKMLFHIENFPVGGSGLPFQSFEAVFDKKKICFSTYFLAFSAPRHACIEISLSKGILKLIFRHF